MRRAELALVIAALIWGVAFLFQKTAMTAVGPLTFLCARAVIATTALTPLALREQRVGSPWPWAPVAGVLFFVAGGLQQTGLVTASVTNATFLTALYVVAVPFLAWAAWRRPPPRRVWIGAVMALIGVWALSGGNIAVWGRGDWLAAGGSVFWAGYMLATEKGSAASRPIGFTAVVFATVAVLSFPLAIGLEHPTAAALRAAVPEILFVGLFSSALTFALFTMALAHVSGARAAVILSSEAVFAAILGMIFLGERLSALGWAGAAVIIAAVLIVQRK